MFANLEQRRHYRIDEAHLVESVDLEVLGLMDERAVPVDEQNLFSDPL